MSTKIERQPAAKTTTSNSVSPSTSGPVMKADVVAAATALHGAPAGAENFTAGGPRADTKAINPPGQHVGFSADPDALWGNVAPAANEQVFETQLTEFKKLTPAAQQQKLHAMMENREELAHRIHKRTGELDKKWKKLDVGTRSDTLRKFLDRSPDVDPATRKEVGAMLSKAEAAQTRMNEIKYAIATTPTKGRDNKAMRKKLSTELKALRKTQKDEIKAAAKLLDARGFKTDRLASAEGTIDPKGAAGPNSLLNMMTQYLDLSWMISTFNSFSRPLMSKSDVQRHEEKQEEQVKVSQLNKSFERSLLKKELVEKLNTLESHG